MIIAADTHCHTLASSHAFSTVSEIASSAHAAGLKAVAITDHAMAAPDSPHLWHFHNLPKAVPRTLNGVTLLFGAEVNILDFNGNVDMNQDELRKLDWIVASMHREILNEGSIDDYTDSYIKVAQNPLIDVIGHPCSPHLPFHLEPVLKAFRDNGKLVEVNESNIAYKSGSIESYVSILSECMRLSVPIVVNTDAHFCGLIGKIERSAKLLEELNFPKELIVNLEWEPIAKRVMLTRKRDVLSS